MTQNNSIEAEGLVKHYGDVKALDGVSFSAGEGTVLGLLGPNGAGKSTAVKILTTLSRADEGRARVAGVDVAADPDAVRAAIGVVAQGTGADQEATARENLQLQGRLFGYSRHKARARALALLETFKLADAGNRLVRNFSGGMQRRLDLALALVHRPRVLFLDEPTTGLDPEVRAELWRQIEGLTMADGTTVLLTTHYLDEADRLADSLVFVDHGRVVAQGTPAELKGEIDDPSLEGPPSLEDVYLRHAGAVA
jgi:ABC-2 type transport system ATP-binding protein